MHSVRITEWLNSNMNRAYPLVEPADPLLNPFPQDILVDMRLVFLKEAPSPVYLVWFKSNGITAWISFLAGGSVYQVETSLELTSNTIYQRNTSEDGSAILQITLASGALNSIDWAGALVVEPACVLFPRMTRFMGALDMIPIDTAHGTPYVEMEVVDAWRYAKDLSPYYMLSGDIKIEGGYGVQVYASDNVIRLGAVPGYGDRSGYPCFAVHSSSEKCSDKVMHLNGVMPDSFGKVDIETGDGIKATPMEDGGDTVLAIQSTLSSSKKRCKKVS